MKEFGKISSHFRGGAFGFLLACLMPLLLGLVCSTLLMSVGGTVLPPLWLPFGLSIWIFVFGSRMQWVAAFGGNTLALVVLLWTSVGDVASAVGASVAGGVLLSVGAALLSRFVRRYFVRHKSIESSVLSHPIRFLMDVLVAIAIVSAVSLVIVLIWAGCGVFQLDSLGFKTIYFAMSFALGGTSLLPPLILGGKYLSNGAWKRRGPYIGIGAFVSSLVILVWLLNSLAGSARERRFQRLSDRAGEFTEEIRRGLDGIANKVWALRNLWDSSVLVDRHEFHVFSKDSLKAEDNALKAMGWAPIVQSKDFERLEETARANSKWGETLRGIEILSTFSLEPVEDAHEMLPAFFVEPLLDSTWLVGLDLYQSPNFADLAEEVRLSNKVGISDEFEREGRTLRMIAAWVTRPGIVPYPFDSPEDWIQNLDGLVFGLLDLNELIGNARRKSGVDRGSMEIFDVTDLESTSASRVGEDRMTESSQTRTVTVEFGFADRKWQTVFKQTESEIGAAEFGTFAGAQFGVLFSSGLFGLTLFLAIGYTDRIEQEVSSRTRELRESEERFRQISENVREVFWIASGSVSEMIYVSPAYKVIWGRSRRKIYEDLANWFEPVHEDDRERVRKAFKTNGPEGTFDETYRILQPDGTVRWVRDRGFPVNDKKGELSRIVGVAEDISREKEVELELTRSNAELAEFAYVASHDLREPLRMVTSFVQLLERHCDGVLDEKGKGYMAFIVDGAARMRKLIDDLLELSRIGSAGQPFQPVEMRGVIDLAIRNLSVAIDESKAVVEVDGDFPIIPADEGQLIRVFQNLIANAIKFSGGKKPEIKIRSRNDGRLWQIEIEDNGVGFPEDQSERIFVAFQRYKNSPVEIEGSGIGLAVCKRIIERHGGTIGVSSIQGKGSIFHFSIPLVLRV